MDNKKRLGVALCGSYCTYEQVFRELEKLREKYDLIPIMSDTAAETDTRFGRAAEHIRRLTELTGRKVITTIAEAEPLGPKEPLDALLIAPCTGNTLAKLAAGIADGPVTFACKAHLRNLRPVVVAVSTNDGLAAAAANIGALLNRKNYYFVPFGQDDPAAKPCSLKADLGLLGATLSAALEGRQLQPLLR